MKTTILVFALVLTLSACATPQPGGYDISSGYGRTQTTRPLQENPPTSSIIPKESDVDPRTSINCNDVYYDSRAQWAAALRSGDRDSYMRAEKCGHGKSSEDSQKYSFKKPTPHQDPLVHPSEVTILTVPNLDATISAYQKNCSQDLSSHQYSVCMSEATRQGCAAWSSALEVVRESRRSASKGETVDAKLPDVYPGIGHAYKCSAGSMYDSPLSNFFNRLMN